MSAGMKCAVKTCPNYSDEGQFEGPVCKPCLDVLRGFVGYRPATIRRVVESALSCFLEVER